MPCPASENPHAKQQRDTNQLSRTLKELVEDMWNHDGQQRALDLVEDANREELLVHVRVARLDAARDAPDAPRASAETIRMVREGKPISVEERDEAGDGVLLVEKTRRVGTGALTGPIILNRHDEMGELARALNEMCEHLAEVRANLLAETEARVQTLQQLRHADRLTTVGRLAAGMAHELGTPLNVASARADMICEQTSRRDSPTPPGLKIRVFPYGSTWQEGVRNHFFASGDVPGDEAYSASPAD